jgi:hypothetical protein
MPAYALRWMSLIQQKSDGGQPNNPERARVAVVIFLATSPLVLASFVLLSLAFLSFVFAPFTFLPSFVTPSFVVPSVIASPLIAARGFTSHIAAHRQQPFYQRQGFAVLFIRGLKNRRADHRR